MAAPTCTSNMALPLVALITGGTAVAAAYICCSCKGGGGGGGGNGAPCMGKKKDVQETNKTLTGPIALPVVGNLLQLSVKNSCIPALFNQWANTYGPVYLVNLGSVNAVVLNTMAAICQAMKRRDNISITRPNWLPFIKMVYEERGIVWQNGDTQKKLRCFALSAICNDVGDTPLEDRIERETCKLIKELMVIECNGCPYCPIELLHKAVTNILYGFLFGCRFSYSSEKLQKLICMIRMLSEVNILDATTFFPLIASLPVARLSKAVCNMSELICLFEEEIEFHKTSYDSEKVHDIMDQYLKEFKDDEASDKEPISQIQLEVSLIDLFVCCTEPTSSALSWAFLCMAAFPDIQCKCHQEIDAKIGPDRLPKISDKKNLPYVYATIHEVLRRFTILPLGIPHATTDAIEVDGYCIPAETVVICNLQAIHLNDNYWDSPLDFDPDRFYEDDCGKGDPKFIECNNFVPFGIGSRGCIGKELSRDIMFLIFASVLQRFDISPCCDACDMTTCFNGTYGSTWAPHPYKIKIKVH